MAGGAAYNKLQPGTDNLSQSIQYWGGLEQRKVERNKQRQYADGVSIQQSEAKRQQAIDDSYQKDIESIKPVITGVQSVDEINYRATAQAQKRIGDIYREFRQNPSSQSNAQLKMELANLKSFPETLRAVEGKVTNFATDFVKGYAEGKYSKWDEDKLDELGAFIGEPDENGNMVPNYIIDFNKNGQMVAKAMKKDGTYFEKSINAVMNGFDFSSATPSVDAEKFTTDRAKALGKRQQQKIAGGFKTVTDDFSSHEELEREALSAALGSVEEPSALAKSVWADEMNMGRSKEDFNENSLKEIEDFLIERMATKYDSTISSTQLRKPDGPTDRQKARAGIQIMKDGGRPVTEYLRPNDKNAEYIGFSLATPVTTGVGNKDKKINSLYIDDSGDIMFKGQEVVKESSTKSVGGYNISGGSKETVYKDITGGGLNSKELNIIANRLGYDNTDGLREALLEKKRNAGFVEEPKKQKEDFRKKYNY